MSVNTNLILPIQSGQSTISCVHGKGELNNRKVIVVTDLEPDDRKALDVLASRFTEENILFVGTTILDSNRKRALTRRVLDQLGLGKVPVYQGAGNQAQNYPLFGSNNAAKTYNREGVGILSESDLTELSDVVGRPAELEAQMTAALESAEENSIEFVMLSPPTDLAKVLTVRPELRKKISQIHIMGGWAEANNENRTTYNWNMDPEGSQKLMQMSDVPMMLYSSHVLKGSFNGGSINRSNFPAMIAKIEACKDRLPSLLDAAIATESWNHHVVDTLLFLKPIIEPFADHQFTPTDPAVAVGMINPKFILAKRNVRIDIDLGNQTKQGCLVRVTEDPTSSISLIEEVSTEIFEQEMITTYDRLLVKLAKNLVIE